MRLKITEPAEKDLCVLDRRTEKRIRTTLDNLLIDPRSVDIRPLKGKKDYLRIRVGDYRAILKVDSAERIVYVLKVKHRREAYR